MLQTLADTNARYDETSYHALDNYVNKTTKYKIEFDPTHILSVLYTS